VSAVRAQLTMQVRIEDREAFIEAWRTVAAGAAGRPGFVGQDLAEVQRLPGTFVISSDWTSIEAFTAFERDPAQDDLTAELRRLRLDASMTILAVVARG
jgi:heme-degrading monooxygenase HmoA